MKRLFLAVFAGAALLMGCTDAEQVSKNLSQAADQFEIQRRVVFYNGITGEYMLEVQGLCSIGRGQQVAAVTIVCKTGPNKYKKHYLGLSDNVTFFAEQVDAVGASPYHYRVIFKPQAIIPDIDFTGSGKELLKNSNGDS